jgi:hypothetical protein
MDRFAVDENAVEIEENGFQRGQGREFPSLARETGVVRLKSSHGNT